MPVRGAVDPGHESWGGVEIMRDELRLALEGRCALRLTDLHGDADEVHRLKGLMAMFGIEF